MRVCHFTDNNKTGPDEIINSREKVLDARTVGVVQLSGDGPIGCEMQDGGTTPKPSYRSFRSSRADTAVQTDLDAEPAGRVHRHHEERRYMWSDSPTTYYNNVSNPGLF